MIMFVIIFFIGDGIFNQHSEYESMIMASIKGGLTTDKVNVPAFSYRNGRTAFCCYFMEVRQKEVAVNQ